MEFLGITWNFLLLQIGIVFSFFPICMSFLSLILFALLRLSTTSNRTSDSGYPCLLSYLMWNESEVAQSCLTLWYPMDCSLPGSSVHGIFQAIVLEWIAIFFSRGSSRPRDRTWVSYIVDRCFAIWAIREVVSIICIYYSI